MRWILFSSLLATVAWGQVREGETISIIGVTRIVVEPPPPPKPVTLTPRAVVADNQIKPLQRVFFRSGGADVLPASLEALDAVAEVVLNDPLIHVVRIEAHTDSVQGKNQSLSQRRANWVRSYLIKKGVADTRLIATGYGASRPIASNATRAGRQANRRVEFIISE